MKPKDAPPSGDFPIHLNRISEKLRDKYKFVEEIARGKTGVAYRIESVVNEHSYCLKTISPSITSPEQIAAVRDTIVKEFEILLPLNHRCLPRIYEHDSDTEMPFYVCSYHPGRTFEKFKDQGGKINLEQSAYLIWALMDALEYLHGNGRTHCDLHLKNIMVSEEVFRHGILIIDYGSGHRESGTTPETTFRGNVYLKDVQNEALQGNPVDREAHLGSFQNTDFSAVGHLLASMRECFFSNATPIQTKAYLNFCSQLENRLITDWRKARSSFLSVLDPYRAVSENTRLFVSKGGFPQTIRIPVSRSVAVGEASLRIINTRVFQKLRGVRQLSFCDWRLPGALHSRFEHSLGVFNLVKRAIDHLIHDSTFRNQVDTDDVNGTLLASLTHDIGHYPFAHVTEQYAASRFPGSDQAKSSASHFRHTLELLRGDKEILGVANDLWGKDALHLCIKTLNSQMGILSELIDGPIDCDKMDYLTRDALHCGVPYGQGLDVDGMLRSLCPVSDGRRLGVKETGVAAVEGLMILQHQMLSTVYWHETTRGIICMFHAVLAHLVGDNINKFVDLVNALKGCSSETEALNKVILKGVEEQPLESRPHLIKLVDFHNAPDFKRIYTPICTYRPSDAPPKFAHSNVHNVIVKRDHTGTGSSAAVNWPAVKELRSAFEASFKEKKIKMDARQLVVDVPIGKKPHQPVFVKNTANAQEQKITEISHLKDSIFDQPAAFVSPVRVFIDPELRQTAGNRLDSIILSAEENFHQRKSSDASQKEEAAA